MVDSLVVGVVDFGSHNDRHFEVVVTTPDGRRFHYFDGMLSEQVASRLVDRIRDHGRINTAYWVEGYPVYGSPAFEGQERQAHFWSQSLRAGNCELGDVPSSLCSLL